jgi:hypothetical protein
MIHSVSQTPSSARLYEPLFFEFGLSQYYSNSYDPDVIDVTFEFTGPSGIMRVIPAFYTTGMPGWQARISPMEIGQHNCRIVAVDHTGQTATHELLFHAASSNKRGFIRIDPQNPLYLRFDNGQPYFPIGHNFCWAGSESHVSSWMSKMAAAGENWTRYWAVPYVAQGLEWGSESGLNGLGRYSQNNSEKLDAYLEQARLNGIQVQVCLDSFNGWNTWLYAQWYENPYNTANGGMLAEPGEYFTNLEARRYAKNYIRYVVARWAYNTSVLCWEFWNEVNLISGYATDGAEWHRFMGDYIRSIDPFDHLRTTSHCCDGPGNDRPEWQLEEMDLIQLHSYSSTVPGRYVEAIRYYQALHKPVLFGEAPCCEELHDLIWGSAVSQSGAMAWYWEEIDAQDLYHVFTPLASFLKGEDWAPLQMGPASITVDGDHTFEVYGSAGAKDAFVYGLNPSPNAEDVRITVHNLEPATYHVEYWDTQNGHVMDEEVSGTVAGDLILALPPFDRDIAIKVRGYPEHYLLTEPALISRSIRFGEDLPPDTITLSIYDIESLDFDVTDDAEWLIVDGPRQITAGNPVELNVSYQTRELAAGVYETQITVDAPAASNSPTTIGMILLVEPFPPDFDGDGDVDQSDFGQLQSCLTGPGIFQADMDCLSTDLDKDEDTDSDDLSAFLQCKTGPGQIPDPTCLE